MNESEEKYAKLYNRLPEYVQLRKRDGEVWEQYMGIVLHWKLKYLKELCVELDYKSVLEVGCGTGDLLANFPAPGKVKKIGIDISTENIIAAKNSYPDISFYSGMAQDVFVTENIKGIDIGILSDILEHVEDDSGLLKDCGNVSKYVVLNLPIEKVPEYANRVYGINDVQGHLRAYSIQDAIDMCERAGMKVVRYIEKKYVQEPIFRTYLFNKLVKKAEDPIKGLIKYNEELLHIDLTPEYYKSNFFALLKK